MVRWFAFVIALALFACGSKKPAPVTKPPPVDPGPASGKLALDIEPSDAEVEVDGTPRGKASELKELELVAGPHQIVITKPGFEVWRGEVAIETTETIQVRLVKKK